MDISEYAKFISKNIKKSLVVFDLETTGLDTGKDQLIQFAAIKISPKGVVQELTFKCKPTCPIHPKAFESHGYKIEDLSNESEFATRAKEVVAFFRDAEIVAGFNIARFDVKMLDRQLTENGYENTFKDKIIYDSYPVYCSHSGRKLADAFKFYTSGDIEDAHDALGDVKSTVAVLAKQAEREQTDIKTIAEKTCDAKSGETSVLDRYIVTKDKKHFLNFGKHKGKALDQVEKSFLKWVMGKDFPKEVKAVVKKYL